MLYTIYIVYLQRENYFVKSKKQNYGKLLHVK